MFPRICTGPRKPRRVLDEGEGLGDEEYEGEGEEEDLEAHQSRLEQRLGALNQLCENRGWGVRDKDVHKFLVSEQPERAEMMADTTSGFSVGMNSTVASLRPPLSTPRRPGRTVRAGRPTWHGRAHKAPCFLAGLTVPREPTLRPSLWKVRAAPRVTV